MSERVRARATVRGRVQMVGYRMFVAEHAGTLRGSVVNQPDGSVECLLEGPAEEVERLLTLLRRGPRHAEVDSVDVVREPYVGDEPPFMVRG